MQHNQKNKTQLPFSPKANHKLLISNLRQRNRRNRRADRRPKTRLLRNLPRRPPPLRLPHQVRLRHTQMASTIIQQSILQLPLANLANQLLNITILLRRLIKQRRRQRIRNLKRIKRNLAAYRPELPVDGQDADDGDEGSDEGAGEVAVVGAVDFDVALDSGVEFGAGEVGCVVAVHEGDGGRAGDVEGGDEGEGVDLPDHVDERVDAVPVWLVERVGALVGDPVRGAGVELDLG